MCLETIKKTYPTPLNEERIGYKVLEKDGDIWFTPFEQYALHNNWNKINDKYNLQAFDGTIYKTGFHIFKHKDDAISLLQNMKIGKQKSSNYKVVKVKYRNIVAEGIQLFRVFLHDAERSVSVKIKDKRADVDVALSIKVMKEVKK